MRPSLSSLLLFYFISSFQPSYALRLPAIFSDHMVLQRDIQVPIWGTSTPYTQVSVQFGTWNGTTQADSIGKWLIRLPYMKAGGPFQMTIKADETITLHNIMVGEVWLASGQSNMEWTLQSGVLDTEKEIAAASHPDIRFFQVPKNVSRIPLSSFSYTSSWTPCTPNSAKNMSAVAYYFARDLQKEQSVAVGIIQTYWGGSVCEAWTSQEMLANLEDFVDPIRNINSSQEDWEALQTKANQLGIIRTKLEESARKGEEKGVNTLDFNDSKWETTQYPINMWQMGLPWHWGFVWVRKWIEVHPSMAGKPATLHLGKIAFEDITWFNGVRVGQSKDQETDRVYQIPGNLIKSGKNLIAIRILSRYGAGKIGTPSSDPRLKSALVATQSTSISLKGTWSFNSKIEPPFPVGTDYYNQPSALYNAMIAPLIPYGIKGVIWYQGESNADRAFQYRSLFPSMIKDWRSRWNQGDFPFLFAQLANYEQRNTTPQESQWAELREAQRMALHLPNTGMAVTIDLGDAEDIHPRNKKPVGQRLYTAARHIAYHLEGVHSGPVFDYFTTENEKIRLYFTQTGSGLQSKTGETLAGFAIAGHDKKFYWAEATLEGQTVVVKSSKVKHPAAVRYAWDKNPPCSLYNAEGLPASPFRTDQWKGITK